LQAEHNAVTHIRKYLYKLGLPKTVSAFLAVTASAAGKALTVAVIFESPIFLWCCQNVMRQN
jgi:hypothetical protein